MYDLKAVFTESETGRAITAQFTTTAAEVRELNNYTHTPIIRHARTQGVITVLTVSVCVFSLFSSRLSLKRLLLEVL